ncbi:MAG: MerR family transcriptional regulator [Clostridium sartagoforme]|nr:MerR family transcriptional regulator [Clostridium sartagoforme]
MLSIGDFSNICKVSTKTLRYYAEIGLILPEEINPENGYRYYSINQLQTMLLIKRLKTYNFSLEEIKTILQSEDLKEEKLYLSLINKKKEIEKQLKEFEDTLNQLNTDISNLKEGKSIMSYLKDIDITLVEMPPMNLLYIRKMVQEHEFPEEYNNSFGKLLKQIQEDKLTITAPPMVLFHSSEYSPFGLDTEFAIPVKEYVKGTRDFTPGLCLKTVVHGSYSDLSSVYTKQIQWAEKEGYKCTSALFEVYVTDPTEVANENELITEIYYPVKKKV